MKKSVWTGILIAVLILGLSCAGKKPLGMHGEDWTSVNQNLHQVDGPPAGKDAAAAFRLYRSGAPTKETFAKWCGEYKISRVIDMAGTAKTHELKFQKEGVCPNLQIIYSEKQEVNQPVTEEFLKFFDAEVEKARRDQVGLLFRCTTGSHRTGRLAAYYQMSQKNMGAEDAIEEMNREGVTMFLFEKELVPQVYALDDYIHHRPCSQPKNSCVIP